MAENHESASELKTDVPAPSSTTSPLVVENEQLRNELSQARESVKTLSESLAVSNEEAKDFRERYSELQLQMEAIGLDSVAKDRKKLQQRLLNALSDLRLMEKERDQYRDHLLGLSEVVLRLLKTSTGIDEQTRLDVEGQLRSANQLASKSRDLPEETGTLMYGRVISVKQEWSLVVGNIGEKQGVKMGMPLRVMRADELIATLRVVDVRQRICGAVIQDLRSGKIKVGDRLQADARQM